MSHISLIKPGLDDIQSHLLHSTQFKALYRSSSVKGEAYMCSKGASMPDKSKQRIWAPPLTDVLRNSAIMQLKYATIMFDFYPGLPQVCSFTDLE